MTARGLESETATRFCVLNTKEKTHKRQKMPKKQKSETFMHIFISYELNASFLLYFQLSFTVLE